MKIYFNLVALLLMVSGTLFLSSCKEDDKDPDSDSPIVGVWEYESADVAILINGQDFIDYVIETFELSEEQAEEMKEGFDEEMNYFEGMSWEFKADGSMIVTSPEGNESGTWSLSSDNEKLTVTSDGESEVLDVSSLTSSTMKLNFEEESAEDLDEDGEDEVFEITIALTLSK